MMVATNDYVINGKEGRDKITRLYENAARGAIDNVHTINKFGRNVDVDLAADEDVIGIGGTLELFSAAATIDIVSGSGNDDLTGSGAEKVMVYGLDANYEIQQLEMIMNGTGAVTSTGTTWTFVYRAEVTQSANGANTATNAGIITISITGGNDVMNIAIGDNQTQHCAYMIPANHVGLMKRHKFAIEAHASAIVVNAEVWVKPFGLPWLLKYRINITRSERDDMVYEIPKVLPEKSIIKLRIGTDTNDVLVNGFFDILVIPKPE